MSSRFLNGVVVVGPVLFATIVSRPEVHDDSQNLGRRGDRIAGGSARQGRILPGSRRAPFLRRDSRPAHLQELSGLCAR